MIPLKGNNSKMLRTPLCLTWTLEPFIKLLILILLCYDVFHCISDYFLTLMFFLHKGGSSFLVHIYSYERVYCIILSFTCSWTAAEIWNNNLYLCTPGSRILDFIPSHLENIEIREENILVDDYFSRILSIHIYAYVGMCNL